MPKHPSRRPKPAEKKIDVVIRSPEVIAAEKKAFEDNARAERENETAKQQHEADTGLAEHEVPERAYVVAIKDGFDGVAQRKAGDLFVWEKKPIPAILGADVSPEAKEQATKHKKGKITKEDIPSWTRLATDDEIKVLEGPPQA